MEDLFGPDEIVTLKARLESYTRDVYVTVELLSDGTWRSEMSESEYWDGGATGCDGYTRKALGTFQINNNNLRFEVTSCEVIQTAFGRTGYTEKIAPFTVPFNIPFTVKHVSLTQDLVTYPTTQRLQAPIPDPTPTPTPTPTAAQVPINTSAINTTQQVSMPPTPPPTIPLEQENQAANHTKKTKKSCVIC
jgi:hypothetical protein